MKDMDRLFREELEIPDIVKAKADAALAGIAAEGKNMKHSNRTYIRKLIPTIVAACLCIALLCVAAYAAIHHDWSRGALTATEDQQQELTENGMAVVLDEQQDPADLAVTHDGVTVTPMEIITDGDFAWLTFSVSGLEFPERCDPALDMAWCYLGDVPSDDKGLLNSSGSFYDGTVIGEDARAVYEDGSPLEADEDGNAILYYVDEDGSLEFTMQCQPVYGDVSLLGQTVHVGLQGLTITAKDMDTISVEGPWEFTLTMPEGSDSQIIEINEPVPGTDFTLTQVELSPISAHLTYSVDGDVEIVDDDLGVPELCGAVLSDGTELPYLADGGSVGYSEDMAEAYNDFAFDLVIDPDAVTALLIRTEPGSDCVSIPLNK